MDHAFIQHGAPNGERHCDLRACKQPSSMGDGASSEDGDKASGLLRAVWFRQMLHRRQSSSNTAPARGSSASASDTGGTGASTDRQSNVDTATLAAAADDSDRKPMLPADSADRRRLPRVAVVEERRRPDAAGSSPMTPEPPADVPRGSCAVYVGAERRRFVVPTAYLGMPVFRRLLEKAEEFEFDYHGAGLTIPCATEAFKYILVVMERHQRGLVDDEGNPKDREPEPSGTR